MVVVGIGLPRCGRGGRGDRDGARWRRSDRLARPGRRQALAIGRRWGRRRAAGADRGVPPVEAIGGDGDEPDRPRRAALTHAGLLGDVTSVGRAQVLGGRRRVARVGRPQVLGRAVPRGGCARGVARGGRRQILARERARGRWPRDDDKGERQGGLSGKSV
jgi:hypothetical protein